MTATLETGTKKAIEQLNKNFETFTMERQGNESKKSAKRIENITDTLTAIEEVHGLNAMLEKVGSDLTIDTEIFYTILNKLTGKPVELTRDHAKRFFMETKKLEELRLSVKTLEDVYFNFPIAIIYLLLGTDAEEVSPFKCLLFDEDFNDIILQHEVYYYRGLMSCDKFIESLMWWLDMMRKGKEVSEAA